MSKATPIEKQLLCASRIELAGPPREGSKWKEYFETHAVDNQIPRFKVKSIKKRKHAAQEEEKREKGECEASQE